MVPFKFLFYSPDWTFIEGNDQLWYRERELFFSVFRERERKTTIVYPSIRVYIIF